MKKRTVRAAWIVSAAAVIAACYFLAPRHYPVPADTMVGSRTIQFEDKPASDAEITVARYFLDQITGDFNEMKALLPDTEMDRITVKNEEAAFLDGKTVETYLLHSITTLTESEYGDSGAFPYYGIEELADRNGLKDYAVIRVNFYMKCSDEMEALAPQWGTGEYSRSFLVSKKRFDRNYKIYDFGMMEEAE